MSKIPDIYTLYRTEPIAKYAIDYLLAVGLLNEDELGKHFKYIRELDK